MSLGSPFAPATPERPIFATADGRSRRGVRWVGRLAALLLATWACAVAAGALGYANLPLLAPRLVLHAGALDLTRISSHNHVHVLVKVDRRARGRDRETVRGA